MLDSAPKKEPFEVDIGGHRSPMAVAVDEKVIIETKWEWSICARANIRPSNIDVLERSSGH